MKWDDKSIDISIEILNESETVAQACNEISAAIEEEITPSSLRKAFQRNGYDSPSCYIIENNSSLTSSPHYDEDDEDLEGEKKESSDEYEPEGDYHYNEINDLYLVFVPHKRKPRKVPGKVMRAWNEAYSNMSAGGAETINQICKTWGISRKDFIAIKRAMGWTHDDDPYTDEEMLANDPIDLAESLVQKKRAEFEKHFRKKEWKEIENDAKKWREMAFYLGVEPELKSVKHTVELIGSVEKYCENIKVKKVLDKIDLQIDSEVGSSLIIPVSDLHVGKKFKATNLKSTDYNISVLKERLQRAMSYIDMIKPHVEDRVNNLFYSSLGDNFEAIFANMRPGQHLTMDLHGIDQYKEVIEFHVNLMNFIMEAFPNAKMTACFQGGNHDRIFADKRWDSEEILNYIVTDRIASEFKDVPDDKLEVLLGAPVTSVMLPNGVNLISQHGHLKNIKTSKDVMNFIGVHGEPAAKRYLVSQGHFHHWEVRWEAGFNYKFYMNSSFCGKDEYAMDKIHTGANAEFMMIESSKNNDIFYGPYNLENDEF